MHKKEKDVIKIADQMIGLGEEVQVNLEVARLPSRTNIEIPVFVSRAEQEGPVVLLSGGMHGDEINGIEIVRRILNENHHRPLKGTVICIPLINVYGFINNARDMPDGKDLNRSFPGSKSGSLASRVAYSIINDVLPVIDVGIDFHTGGADRANYPQIRCVLKDKRNEELARAFHPEFILNASHRNKSFRKESFDKGKRILVYEGGETNRFDEHVITEGIAGARRVLKHLGMRSTAPKATQNTRVLKRSTWLRAPHSGLFHSLVKNGSSVKKNEQVGLITDPFGDFQVKVKARQSGYLIGINNNPVVNQGDALMHMGLE